MDTADESSPFSATFVIAQDEQIDASTALHEIWGNLELTVGERVFSVGPFPGSVLLLATAEELLARLALLEGNPVGLELIVVGDVGPIWLRRAGRHLAYSFLVREQRSPNVAVEDIVIGFQIAIANALQTMLYAKPWVSWSPAEKSVLRSLSSFWRGDVSIPHGILELKQ